jgi:4a-hydroxytetrahydrobiopterin dehydratase
MPSTRLNSKEIDQGLSTLDNWALDVHTASISKEWVFDSFKTNMCFFSKVGDIADRQDHHPEFFSSYTRARIRLTTHDAYGLTPQDFELALAIDRLVQNEFSENLM